MSHDLDVSRSAKAWKVSEKHGAGEWLAERFTSLALIPLTAWCVWVAYRLAGGGFDAAIAFVTKPANASILGLTLLVCVWHMYMGLKVIIDDYIGKPGTRGLLLFLVFLLCAVVLVAGLGALLLPYVLPQFATHATQGA